jgi:hypothetical protein
MATNETTRGGGRVGGFLNALAALVTIIVVLGIGYTFLPSILATPMPSTFTLPTANVAPSQARARTCGRAHCPARSRAERSAID